MLVVLDVARWVHPQHFTRWTIGLIGPLLMCAYAFTVQPDYQAELAQQVERAERAEDDNARRIDTLVAVLRMPEVQKAGIAIAKLNMKETNNADPR